ncbi:hypothetical protein G6011_11643 [Alternaria panax]|uniref:Uncharacterized protein n=1 Tax=Alternaria panax TaxID=48097 RepID=A0AAD4NSL5_9PLEO|nr:hypothetical protein G6011_11643 [Alternaria panax]
MSSRYDALQASEDLNGSAQLQEDQNFSVASEELIDSEQHEKDKDVQTSIISAHEAERPMRWPRTVVRRVGKLPCILLFLSIFGTTAFVVYITSLWFNAGGNKTWKEIALSGWMTRSIAIAAVVLRTSTTVQAGIASSMLAAVALESTAGVFLEDLLPLSLMRASSAAPHALLAHTRLGINGRNWMLLALAAIISFTTMSLQLTSTILLADVNAGFVLSGLAPYEYVSPKSSYKTTGNWQTAPCPWPIFAEHAQDNPADGSLGYSYTGFMLRALLPLSDTRTRSSIHTYEGLAPVSDARTICIRPNITNTQVVEHSNDSDSRTIHGKISVPSDLLPILLAETPFEYFQPIDFACELSEDFIRDQDHEYVAQHASAWDLTVCDLSRSAWSMLKSGFHTDEFTSSLSFLLMNYTGYAHQRVQDWAHYPPLEFANFNDTTPGLHYHNSNEWLDLKQDAQTLEWWDGYNFADTKLSFSLCLSASDVFACDISASSRAPVEESMYFYDVERSQFRYDHIRRQMVRSSTLSLEERNVLTLHPQSWLYSNMSHHGSSYINIGEMMTLPSLQPGIEYPTLHLMDNAKAEFPRSERHIGGLGLEILQQGGTPAEAMQSMLMSLVLADYQQNVFTEVPNGTPYSKFAKRGDFITAQVPGGNGRPATNPAGATRSYTIVMVATAIHSVTICVILMLFIRGTRNTLI